MPSIRASQNVDTTRLTPVAPRSTAVGAPVMTIAPAQSAGASALMGSSLPSIATGNDSLTRQYYNTGRLPQRRFLPMGLA